MNLSKKFFKLFLLFLFRYLLLLLRLAFRNSHVDRLGRLINWSVLHHLLEVFGSTNFLFHLLDMILGIFLLKGTIKFLACLQIDSGLLHRTLDLLTLILHIYELMMLFLLNLLLFLLSFLFILVQVDFP